MVGIVCEKDRMTDNRDYDDWGNEKRIGRYLISYGEEKMNRINISQFSTPVYTEPKVGREITMYQFTNHFRECAQIFRHVFQIAW